MNSEVGNPDAAKKGYCGSNSDDEGCTELFIDTISQLLPHHSERIGMEINEFYKATHDAEYVHMKNRIQPHGYTRIRWDPSHTIIS